jgi:hypothetical protein
MAYMFYFVLPQNIERVAESYPGAERTEEK